MAGTKEKDCYGCCFLPCYWVKHRQNACWLREEESPPGTAARCGRIGHRGEPCICASAIVLPALILRVIISMAI